MSAFKNYFDGIDTTANTAAECGEIRSKAAKIKKRRKVASSALGVTLAVMMTTTVAVSAVGGWNITEIIGRWFNGDTELITDNIAAVTEENAENKFEFLDISPNGAIIDKNMIIFFLDVTRNDGNIFDCAEFNLARKDGSLFYDTNGETVAFMPMYYFDYSAPSFVVNVSFGEDINYDGEYIVPTRQYIVDDGDPTDNKITAAFCCDRTSLESQMRANGKMTVGSEVIDVSDKLSYEIKSVKLKTGGLADRRIRVLYEYDDGSCSVDGFSTERINGGWSGELMLDFEPSKSNTVTIEPNKASTFKVHPAGTNGALEEYDNSFNVERITLSQMSISFDMSAEAPEQERFIETYRIGEIIMKNGDTIPIQPYTLVPCLYHESGNLNEHLPPEQHSTKWEISGSVMLTEPIDPDDVAAVRLGDTTFPIE